MSSSPLLRSLQRRITEMQPLRLDDRAIPTAPALAPLLPGGTLRAGGSYAVHGSLQLSLAFIASASSAGHWCGVIGVPDLGAEAAAELGIALDRCVLIPDGEHREIGLAASLSEVLTLVLVRSDAPSSGDAERISSRLREHGAALISLGDWPRSETTLRVTGSRWRGLGEGHGVLTTHELEVQSRDRRGTKHHIVRFERGTLANPPTAARALAAL